ncbi:MAG: helix-turn-helix domain-containing protein [Saprospiraceae bacterium]|nr:helix-turn-helix domain-containing protein [Saprospiraceae bacterium]
MKDILEQVQKPSKNDQRLALASYDALSSVLDQLKSENPEIEIAETEEKIKIPVRALKLLASILRALSEGHPVSIIANAAELTTQAAAEMIGCSRPHLVKLLEEGRIPFTKIGRHRRIRAEDMIKYRNQFKADQKALLVDLMKEDEESGLYDS